MIYDAMLQLLAEFESKRPPEDEQIFLLEIEMSHARICAALGLEMGYPGNQHMNYPSRVMLQQLVNEGKVEKIGENSAAMYCLARKKTVSASRG